MDYKEIAEEELRKNNVSWCCGQCGKSGHKRGFVVFGEPVIHLETKLSTRSTLHRFFHELGHAVLEHGKLRSFQREEQAERFAFDKFREYGIPLPREVVYRGKLYVMRKKRHGDNIIKSKKNI